MQHSESTDAYCGSGCQPGFGNRKPASLSPSSTPAKAPVAPSSALSTMNIPVVSSPVSSSRITSSATSSQPMSTLLTDPVPSSSTTVVSVEDPYTSTLVTSTSALATDVGISSSLEVTSASAAAPEIVSASSEVPTSLATLEITASTNPVVSSLSASASLSESPTTIAELSSTATAPLATSEVASAEVDTVSSIALSTVLETLTETISSTAAPVIIEESTSSSVIETLSLFPKTTASSSAVSSIVGTSTTSALATCNTLAAKYNPSFESGAIAPWIPAGFALNSAYSKTQVFSAASAPFTPLDGSHTLYSTFDRSFLPGLAWIYTLQNVYIPAGSNLNCALGVKVTQGSNPNQVRNMQAWLYIDNQRVNPGTNNYFTGTSSSLRANDWRRIGGAGVANAQDVHTVMFAMQSNLGGVYNQGTAKYIRIKDFAAESLKN
ncbi:hypothetical protein AA0116_g3 [Alternaria tenuissima]|nr:hypothetical protein AA0116_g3 [Alternaria tenuissima]